MAKIIQPTQIRPDLKRYAKPAASRVVSCGAWVNQYGQPGFATTFAAGQAVWVMRVTVSVCLYTGDADDRVGFRVRWSTTPEENFPAPGQMEELIPIKTNEVLDFWELNRWLPVLDWSMFHLIPAIPVYFVLQYHWLAQVAGQIQMSVEFQEV